jgi:dTDP-glucose 4,6-dehydratase
LAQKIIEKVGTGVSVELDPQRIRPQGSEVLQLRSDNSQARQVLGWHPETDLNKGLEMTITWLKNHLDDYRIGRYEL